jgi:hypothetical protein
VSAPLSDRWRLALPLVVPALAGFAYLAAFGAPARLIAVNAGALALAMAWVRLGRMPSGAAARLGLAAAVAALLFLPLVTGPEAGGVSRWLPGGPVQLHSGGLLLPLVTVLAAREPHWTGAALLALAGAALALQPDAASLLALGVASAVLAATTRSIAYGIVGAAALGLATVTFGAGALEPQVFTEHVLPHVWQSAPPAALALAATLFIVPQALLVTDARLPLAGARALAALLAGFGIAALLGPFPYPLIGYGAAPILGLGLALGATRSTAQGWPDGEDGFRAHR